MGTIWEDLMKDKYRKIKTPPRLVANLKDGEKSGRFLHNRYFIDFNVVREDSSAWVVESERISRNGISSGGHYYVNKKNPNQAVWD